MPSDWVQDLDSFTPGAGAGPAKASPADELAAEMKLLNWHKLANEAALKAALLRTKKLKTKEGKPQMHGSVQEKASWMQQIIEEEQSKPLQVSKDFIVEYEQREAKQSERLDSEVQRHIECLRRLRTNIEDRDAMRGRKEQYRYHKAQMEKEKEEFDKRKAAAKVESRALAQASLSDLPADAAEPAGRGTKKDTRRNVQGTLTAVINSLDKLVDLERRISSLEKDSIYDRMDAAAGASEGAPSLPFQAGGMWYCGASCLKAHRQRARLTGGAQQA